MRMSGTSSGSAKQRLADPDDLEDEIGWEWMKKKLFHTMIAKHEWTGSELEHVLRHFQYKLQYKNGLRRASGTVWNYEVLNQPVKKNIRVKWKFSDAREQLAVLLNN